MIRRPVAVMLVILVVGLALGLLALGAFPPAVPPQTVEKVIPNERFQASR